MFMAIQASLIEPQGRKAAKPSSCSLQSWRLRFKGSFYLSGLPHPREDARRSGGKLSPKGNHGQKFPARAIRLTQPMPKSSPR